MSSHYAILGVRKPPHDPPLELVELKTAYRKALLLAHPDKHSDTSYSGSEQISAITTAYACLSNSRLRKEYDLGLAGLRGSGGASGGPAGGEIYDLDELEELEEDGNLNWFRGCRCGEEQGYLLTEKHLEDNEVYYEDVVVEFHEIVIQCKGCSLWIRVQYRVEDEL